MSEQKEIELTPEMRYIPSLQLAGQTGDLIMAMREQNFSDKTILQYLQEAIAYDPAAGGFVTKSAGKSARAKKAEQRKRAKKRAKQASSSA